MKEYNVKKITVHFIELVDVFTISSSHVITKMSKRLFIQVQLFQYSSILYF